MEFSDESEQSLAPRMIEALSLQVSLQLDLLRAELDRDLWTLVRKLLPFSLGIPLIGLGYTLCSVAASLAIASLLMPAGRFWGPAAGMAIVGVLHLVLGGGITWFASREKRPRGRSPATPRSSDDT